MSSLLRGHANLLSIVPILVYVLPKWPLIFVLREYFFLDVKLWLTVHSFSTLERLCLFWLPSFLMISQLLLKSLFSCRLTLIYLWLLSRMFPCVYFSKIFFCYVLVQIIWIFLLVFAQLPQTLDFCVCLFLSIRTSQLLFL